MSRSVHVVWLERDVAFRRMMTALLTRRFPGQRRVVLHAAETAEHARAMIGYGLRRLMLDLVGSIDDTTEFLRTLRGTLELQPIVWSDALTSSRCARIATAGGLPFVKNSASVGARDIAKLLSSKMPTVDVASLPDHVRRSEIDIQGMRRELAKANNKLAVAARNMGVPRSTLQSRLRKAGFETTPTTFKKCGAEK